MPAPVAHRRRLLRAMGVTPLRLRQPAVGEPEAAAAVAAPEASSAQTPATTDLVLVLPAGCEPRHLDLLGRAMTAFGPRFARAARVEVDKGAVTGALPAAQAYLAFGEAQARALGRDLDAAVMARADVILLDTPADLAEAAGKRRLWTAVGALRRRWRQQRAAEH